MRLRVNWKICCLGATLLSDRNNSNRTGAIKVDNFYVDFKNKMLYTISSVNINLKRVGYYVFRSSDQTASDS